MNKKWFVYILECLNGTLYTGSTNNLERRVKQHTNGQGATYTRIFGVKAILYSEEFEERIIALRREREIKKFPRIKKLALIKK